MIFQFLIFGIDTDLVRGSCLNSAKTFEQCMQLNAPVHSSVDQYVMGCDSCVNEYSDFQTTCQAYGDDNLSAFSYNLICHKEGNINCYSEYYTSKNMTAGNWKNEIADFNCANICHKYIGKNGLINGLVAFGPLAQSSWSGDVVSACVGNTCEKSYNKYADCVAEREVVPGDIVEYIYKVCSSCDAPYKKYHCDCPRSSIAANQYMSRDDFLCKKDGFDKMCLDEVFFNQTTLNPFDCANQCHRYFFDNFLTKFDSLYTSFNLIPTQKSLNATGWSNETVNACKNEATIPKTTCPLVSTQNNAALELSYMSAIATMVFMLIN